MSTRSTSEAAGALGIKYIVLKNRSNSMLIRVVSWVCAWAIGFLFSLFFLETEMSSDRREVGKGMAKV